MAKPKAGAFSVEAIDARNQAQQISQLQPTAPTAAPEESAPAIAPPTQTATTTPTGSYNPNVNYNQLPPTTQPVKSVENVPDAKPFMATDLDKYGLPVYGSGFKGWVRKTWADLTDPKKLLQDERLLSDAAAAEIRAEYDADITEHSQVLEEKFKWSQWGEKFFGLSSKDVAALTAGGKAEREIAEESGQSQAGTAIARAAAIARDTTQNFIWGGLAILSLDDQVVRKIHATTVGLDAVADRFDEDSPDNLVEKIWQNNPVAFAKDTFTIAKAITNGNLTWAEAQETVTKYQAGSEMVYSMMFDAIARAEFEKGIAEGKDPYILSQNLGNLGIELAGSLVGSPSTWLGAAIVKPANIFTKAGRAAGDVLTFAGREVKLFGVTQHVPWNTIARIPNFGEIIGANVGKARIASATARFTEPAVPGLENILKNIDTAAGEAKAIEVLKQSATHTANTLSDMSKHKKWWNLSALDANGKVSTTAKDSSLFIQNMVAQRGIDGALQTMRDMVRARRGGEQGVNAAARLMGNSNNGMIFSSVGNMTAEIVHRLDNDKIFDLIKTHGKDPVKLHEELFKKLEGALHDFVPSVDEMVEAKRVVAESKTLGLEVAQKTKDLADMLDDVPQIVKTVHKLTRVPEAIAKKTTAAMAFTFMNLVPRAWARNITGQAWAIAGQQGLKDAVATSMQAVLGLNKKLSKNITDSGAELLAKRIGYVPPSASAGIGKALNATNKSAFRFGMMPSIQRSEQITANSVVLMAASDHIMKSLPAVVKNLPEWDNLINALPPEQGNMMFSALKRSYGNFDEAIATFRGWVGKGEIEAWRLTEPSEAMRKHLDRLGIMDDFYEVQKTAKSSDEFQTFVDDAIRAYEEQVTAAAQTLPSTLSKLPDELTEFGEDFSKHLPEDQQNVMRELIQGWQNTLGKLDETVDTVMRSAAKIANDVTAQTGDQSKFQVLEGLRSKLNTIKGVPSKLYPEINHVREEVNILARAIDKLSPAEMAQAFMKPVKFKGKEVFNLSKVYPDIDVSKLDKKKMKQLLWTAFFENSATKYRRTNIGAYEKALGTLNEVAELFDQSLDDIAGSGKGGDSPFRVLAKMRNETMQIEAASSWQRFFRQFDFQDSNPGALLKDEVAKFSSSFPEWGGDPNYILESLQAGAKGKNKFEAAAESVDAGKLEKGKNAISYIVKNGGINPDEFPDIMGGKLGTDRAGVMPGLFAKGSHNGIDDVGVKLVEGGFMTADEAADVNKVRDFIRNFATSVVPDDAKANQLALQNMAKNAEDELSFENITMEQARELFKKKKRVPPYDGGLPTEERVLWEGLDEFKQDAKAWADTVVGGWGEKVKTLPVDIQAQLKTAKQAINQRMETVKLEAGIIGESTRNFVLHDYNKTYMDHALTYMLGNSMHYWTTRTYARSVETLLENPKYANIYMKYKQYNTKRHAELPDWYRQNMQVNLPGIDGTNPFFVNLEASINPMYGLTGTDFNDPRKRVDWVSRAVDDMNKLGPSFSPLVSWAIAMHLYNQGEEEAGLRWTNRLLPQTQMIKSASSALDNVLAKVGVDVDTKPVELDPFVQILGGGVDPYERNRVAAAMAMMVRSGEITSEQMIEASREKSGEIWDAAIEKSADARFQGDLTSFFLGAGIRPRTQDDMKIEKFWQDYGAMVASSSMMDADQYRAAWDKMRSNPDYGQFMDALLLSRKAGTEQDQAYAYNVFGRIPPGQLNATAQAVGIDPLMLQAFYDNKGDFSEMGLTPADQQRFMAGIADIGAILAMPDNPTRQAWGIARDKYGDMTAALKQQFGDDILDAIDEMYDADNKDDYLEMNPDVQEALDFQTQYINRDPVLLQYYGGIQKIEQYYKNSTRNLLIKEFGQETYDLAQEYNDPTISIERSKELKKQLKAYLERKKQLSKESLRAIVDLGRLLPDAPQPVAQAGVTPQGVSQNNLFQLTQPPKTAEEWEQIAGTPTMNLLRDYLYNDEEVPYAVRQKLDYIAEQEGYFSGDELMKEILMSLPEVQ